MNARTHDPELVNGFLMKLFRPLSRSLLVLAGLCATLAAHAGEAEIRKNLAAQIPQFVKIEEITKTPMAGLYEVRTNGVEIYYTDEQGNYLLQGNLIDVRARKNLTEERVERLSQVAFDKLPLQDAFKIVRGNGKRKLAVFEDPNCGYCKQFERDMKNIDNVTVHLFLYPVLGPDSTAKSRDIWCSKDKPKAWGDWMTTGVKPEAAAAGCDAAALQRNIEFGRKYNITGTPTLIFGDGTRAPGAIPSAQVEKMLAAATLAAPGR
jgi:thiol:disulfide interchange protein DsbC